MTTDLPRATGRVETAHCKANIDGMACVTLRNTTWKQDARTTTAQSLLTQCLKVPAREIIVRSTKVDPL